MKIIILLLLSTTSVLGHSSKIDSLLNLINNQTHADSVRVSAYTELSKIYWYKNLDSALLFANHGERLALRGNDQISYGNLQVSKAIVYYFKSEDDSALHYLDKAHTIFKKENHQKGLLRTSNNLGLVYSNMGNHKVALEYYLDAIKTAEQLNDFKMLASLNYNTGIIYAIQNQEREALKYYWKAVNYNEEHSGPDNARLNFLTGIGGSFLSLEVYDSADLYLRKAVALAKRLDQELSLADLYQSLGSLNLSLENLDSAHYYYKLSEEINTRTDNPYMLSFNYQGLSAYYVHRYEETQDRQYLRKSKDYGLKLVDLAMELNNGDRLLQGYEKVWNAARSLGDYKTALSYHVKYANLKDSLFTKDQSDQIIAMKEQYETEQKEQQIEMQQAALAQQAAQRNFLIGGIILMLLIVGLIYRSERLKTRKNKQIEALLKEIHHRVKNNLQVISSLLNMQSRNVENEEMLETIREGQNRVKAMSLIHQKLYQNDNVNEIDFREYASELSRQLAFIFNPSGCNIQSEVKGDIKLDIDTAIPLGLILNELVSNAYKYAFEGKKEGTIRIVLDRIDRGELELKVKDDGKGIPSDLNLKHVKSLGLKLVNILTKQLKGSWNYSTHNGTEFLIRFKEAAIAT